MKIAVVGSGISGNSAAWALSLRHDVTLYEKRERPGGHSATVVINHEGRQIPVDTGFIVFNRGNYPNLCRMFEHLGIETQRTSMSFSVSLDGGAMEWCGSGLRAIFAQKSNLFSPRFLFMLKDILRFNERAKQDLDNGMLCGLTFGDYIKKRRISDALRDDYIVPMIAAIWSTPAARMLDYPAESLIRFLDNHRLIYRERPMWETVTGGSRVYVEKLLSRFEGRLLLGRGVERIERRDGSVFIHDCHGHVQRYDKVVIASHTDQALRMLADPTDAERSILSAVQYRPNAVWLHRDPSLMPRRRDAWAAWNYLGTRDENSRREISVTYWMNRLQNIDPRHPVFITLNPPRPPREDLTFGLFDYSHPQFDVTALAAQERLPSIQGQNGTYYCGAWTRYGFHEDGLSSGLAVASLLGCAAPWDAPARIEKAPILEAAE
ncbi:MAG: FAD-dependent oxidoreductase [Nitratireductor sp.]|nr:FAD-dependent oxidoreductase [Nitratireductor sp.]